MKTSNVKFIINYSKKLTCAQEMKSKNLITTNMVGLNDVDDKNKVTSHKS